jgi:hypothetical protein
MVLILLVISFFHATTNYLFLMFYELLVITLDIFCLRAVKILMQYCYFVTVLICIEIPELSAQLSLLKLSHDLLVYFGQY